MQELSSRYVTEVQILLPQQTQMECKKPIFFFRAYFCFDSSILCA